MLREKKNWFLQCKIKIYSKEIRIKKRRPKKQKNLVILCQITKLSGSIRHHPITRYSDSTPSPWWLLFNNDSCASLSVKYKNRKEKRNNKNTSNPHRSARFFSSPTILANQFSPLSKLGSHRRSAFLSLSLLVSHCSLLIWIWICLWLCWVFICIVSHFAFNHSFFGKSQKLLFHLVCFEFGGSWWCWICILKLLCLFEDIVCLCQTLAFSLIAEKKSKHGKRNEQVEFSVVIFVGFVYM